MELEREMEDLRKQLSIREAALGDLALDASDVRPAQRLEFEILKTLRQDLADRELEVRHCDTIALELVLEFGLIVSETYCTLRY